MEAALERRDGTEPFDVVVREGHHHLTRVLRCKPGQFVELFDGNGLVGRGRIQSIARDRILVRVETLWSVREPSPVTTLVCALLKAPAMDSVFRKATELGTSRVFVCATERSVPSRDDKAGEKRLARWKRIAAEACLQCGRPMPPGIEFFPSWTHGLDALDEAGISPGAPAIKALFHVGPGASPAAVLDDGPSRAPLAMAVGPEGGFVKKEIEDALDRGWRSVSLGSLVLRAETAAIVASAFMAQASGRFEDSMGWMADGPSREKAG